jgi:hypothetical protein
MKTYRIGAIEEDVNPNRSCIFTIVAETLQEAYAKIPNGFSIAWVLPNKGETK